MTTEQSRMGAYRRAITRVGRLHSYIDSKAGGDIVIPVWRPSAPLSNFRGLGTSSMFIACS